MKHKQALLSRVSKVVSKFSTKSDAAAFRNAFRTAIEPFDSETRAFLQRAREALERWSGSDNPGEIVSAWSGVYEGLTQAKVPVLARTFLRKIPSSCANDERWKAFLTGCTDAEIVRSIVDRKLIDKPTFRRWLTESLLELYHSAALDVGIEKRAISDARHLWQHALRLGARRSPLISQEEVLVWCYCHLTSCDRRFFEFLKAPKTNRQRCLASLLPHTGSASRFVHFLTLQFANGKKAHAFAEQVLNEIVSLCEAGTTPLPDSASATASAMLLGLTRMHFIVAQSDPRLSLPTSLLQRVTIVCTNVANALLMRLEEDVKAVVAVMPLVLTGRELFDVVQKHLKALPTGSTQPATGIGRQEQFQTYLGRKETVIGVIEALEHSQDESELRDELEVMLYNLDVRSFGEVGNCEPFDSRTHEARSSGVLSGDSIEVVKPGRQLGEGPDSLVIKRALVSPKE